MQGRKQYDWAEIQKFYDEGGTYKSIREKFGATMQTICKAKLRGDLTTRSMSEALKLAHKNSPDSFKHSEETKQKISKIRKEFLKNNPHKVPYVLNHCSNGPSYPELYFLDCFKDSDIISKHRILTYELDFCHLERKIDIEIDGDQHFLDKKIAAHDSIRNQALLDLGWKIFRVKWSAFQKLTKEEKEFIVQSLLRFENPRVECVSYFKKD